MSSLRIAAWRMDWRALNLRSPRLLHIYSAEKKKRIPCWKPWELKSSLLSKYFPSTTLQHNSVAFSLHTRSVNPYKNSSFFSFILFPWCHEVRGQGPDTCMRWSHFTMGSMESGPQNPKGIQTSNLDLVGIKENSIMRWVLVFLPSMPHGELGTQPGGIGEERFSSVRPSITKLCSSDGQAHAFCDLRKTLASPRKAASQAFSLLPPELKQ